MRNLLAISSRNGYRRLRDLALDYGFTKDQAPFAAVRAHILSNGGKRPVNWKEVRASCRERYPEHFSQ